jgi:hypothetical protein
MMQRAQPQRQSTLIAAESLQQRAQPQRQSTLIAAESLQQPAQARLERSGLAQAPSTGKTLLDFSKDKVPGTSGIGATARPPGTGVRMPTSHSVFGVDEIWDREMAKVKKIEEQEHKEEEARQKAEDEKAAKKNVKKQSQGTVADSLTSLHTAAGRGGSGSEPTPAVAPRILAEAPLLPTVRLTSTVPVPTTPSTTDSEDGQPGKRKPQARNKTRKAPVAGNHAWDNSSDEGQDRQTQNRARQLADDSDSDVPLAAAAIRARQRWQADSEEEDQPLAAVVAKKLSSPPRVTDHPTLSAFNPPSFEFDKLTKSNADDDDDDDDKPLGLKRHLVAGGDDDDQPLGMRYSMAPSQMMFQHQAQAQAQVQMQQQQMMLQMAAAAQMRQTMFNPMIGMGMVNPAMGMNGMGMLGSPMAMGLSPAMAGAIQTPNLQLGSTLAVVDPAKHARLDQWRREITDDD